MICGFPSGPFLYPIIQPYGNENFPCLYPIRFPRATFWLIDSLSACAKALSTVRIISDVIVPVLIFSFSKITEMPCFLSSRTYCMLSKVLRAKRDMDFVRIKSIFPFLHCAIMARKSSRFFVCTPEIPSSAKIPASVHPSWLCIFSV